MTALTRRFVARTMTVGLKEGLGAYDAPVVSLAPFPDLTASGWDSAANLTVPADLALNRGVVVIHGLWVHGKYDALMPIACGVIERAPAREVALDPVDDSNVAGTARVSLAGSQLYVWVSLGCRIAGRTHMQHIDLPRAAGADAARPRTWIATATDWSASPRDFPRTARRPSRLSLSRRPAAL
jgi:hypothetical protein